jgi:nucleoside-diphosphate-sugar epimerase
VVADALDPVALKKAVLAARPTHVIHQLTALPKDGVRKAADLEPTNRLRIEGTRNLLDASITAGATRFIVGSFAPFQGIGDDVPADVKKGKDAIDSMERQTLEANGQGLIEGIVLRYGLFYGPDNPATKSMISLVRHRMLPVVREDRSLLPFIHIDDAVSATVAALDHGAPGGVYDIVDDTPASMTEIVRGLSEHVGAPPPFRVPEWLIKLMAPFLARITTMRLPLSNEKARAELEWRPAFPSWREGLSQTFGHAA